MNAEQTTARVWNRRRTEKQRRLAEAKIAGKVIPTDQLVSVMENLLAPGDRVVLEGNNQKQADFPLPHARRGQSAKKFTTCI